LRSSSQTLLEPVPASDHVHEIVALPGRPIRDRLAVVDATRGLALVLMVLDHAATFVRVNVTAETYADRAVSIWGPGWYAAGLLTNISAPLFWCLAGVSVALLAHRERRPWGTDTFLLVRAFVLVLLDHFVIMPEWTPTRAPHFALQFELLTCLGVALLLMIPLRRLPDRALALLTGGLLAGYAAIVRLVPQATLERLPDLARLFVTYDLQHQPQVDFPVLGWLPLMTLGLLIGRRMADGRWRDSGPVVRLALAGVALGLALRLADPGWRFGGGIASFLTMRKGPPGLDFLALNLGLGLLLMAAFLAARPRADRAPWCWLVAWGQAPLFLFVVHLPILYLWAHELKHLLPAPDAWRYALTCAGAAATLLPMARWYRGLKRRHPAGPLHYL
jgi:uncharacterized membrane protein